MLLRFKKFDINLIHKYTCVWRCKFGNNGSPQNLFCDLSIKFKVVVFYVTYRHKHTHTDTHTCTKIYNLEKTSENKNKIKIDIGLQPLNQQNPLDWGKSGRINKDKILTPIFLYMLFKNIQCFSSFSVLRKLFPELGSMKPYKFIYKVHSMHVGVFKMKTLSTPSFHILTTSVIINGDCPIFTLHISISRYCRFFWIVTELSF